MIFFVTPTQGVRRKSIYSPGEGVTKLIFKLFKYSDSERQFVFQTQKLLPDTDITFDFI